MNSPTTSTEQMLATASNGVSSTVFSTGAETGLVWGSEGVLEVGAFFFVILSLVVELPFALAAFRVILPK
jgi:hypothetical protein